MKNTLIRVLIIFLFASLFVLPGLAVVAVGLWPQSEAAVQLKSPPLVGYTGAVSIPHLNWNSWCDSSFQKGFESWFDTRFGARNFLVRFHNQVLYTLFNQANTNAWSIWLGKKKSLFQLEIIGGYFHSADESDRIEFARVARKLARAQELLHSRGIAFVYVLTPTKAEIQPAALPDGPVYLLPLRRRYDVLVEELRKNSINYVDGILISKKLQTERMIDVFPRGGIHWTEIAATFTYNELINAINAQKTVGFTNAYFNDVKPVAPDSIDSDLADLMNLLLPLTDYKVPHGSMHAVSPQLTNKGMCIFEGGSMSHNFVEIARKTAAFAKIRYYVYYTHYKIAYPENAAPAPVNRTSVDWNNEILKSDAIVIEKNAGQNLSDNEKFIDDLLNALDAKSETKRCETK